MSIEPPITDLTPDTANTSDIADNVGPRRSRRGLPALVVLLALAALAAGVLTRMIPGLPARSPGHSAAQLPEEVVVDGLAAQAEAKALEHVVLQLDVPEDCAWPDCTVPWGHVPLFTRFDDGETSVVRTAYDSPFAVLRCWPDFQPDTQEIPPVVDDALVDRLASAIPPLVADTPCPAAHGCADAEAILRVRRDGRLDTFVVDHSTSPDARRIADEVIARLRSWEPSTGIEQCEATTNNMETIWDITDTAVESPPEAESLPYVNMEMFDRSGGRPPQMVEHGAGGQLVHTGSYGWTDVDGSPRPVAATASAQQPGWEFWEVMAYKPTGYWTVPMVHDPVTFAMTLKSPMKLAVVPWIYKGRDIEDQFDVEVYAESLANAATARANAFATEDAQLVPTSDETAFPESEGPDFGDASLAPIATPFPTAPAVTWTDGRPQLPAARGIQTWMQWYRYDEDRAALTRLRQAGFEWFKQRYAWADLQPTGSQGFDASSSDLYIQTVNDLGGRVIIQLAVPPPAWAKDGSGFNEAAWGNFVTAFAERYKDKVAAYEIMNEPNLAREWGGPPNPSAYAGILRVAYESIKAWDPNGVVITAGLAPTADRMPEAMGDVTFLRAMLDASANHFEGAPGSWPIGLFDAIGVHAAGFKAAPDVAPDDAAASAELGGDRTFTFRRIEDLWEEAGRNGDADQPLPRAPFVITEFGWTTDPRPDSPYHWMAVDAATRGQHIAQAFAMGPTLLGGEGNVGPMILFSAADRAWTRDDEAFWWAVADADGNVDGAAREALGLGGE